MIPVIIKTPHMYRKIRALVPRTILEVVITFISEISPIVYKHKVTQFERNLYFHIWHLTESITVQATAIPTPTHNANKRRTQSPALNANSYSCDEQNCNKLKLQGTLWKVRNKMVRLGFVISKNDRRQHCGAKFPRFFLAEEVWNTQTSNKNWQMVTVVKNG